MNSASRVAFNTAIQYLQLVLNVLVGLVSVRIILDALGSSDYGIYDLIGGIIGLLSFISVSLSQTSMRFLSVSIGKKDVEETKLMFRTCFWLHLYMAIALFAILFMVGFFLFDGFLNIPEERVSTARIVYYCMLASLFLNISCTPLIALITAHELFWYTSTIGIMDSLLKLGVAYVVHYFMGDKLFLYGVLMVLITVTNFLLYLFYCLRKFKNITKFQIVPISAMRGVTGFAGWTLLDVLSSIVNRQGYAIVLNKFFGPVTNASFAISRQAEGHVYTISASVINTMKPQIMKSQGAGDTDRVFRLSLTAGKVGFFMMSFLAIPLIVLMHDILALWLKEVPEMAATFCRLLIIACMADQVTKGLYYANQAIGNIMWFSIVVSSLRILALPVSAILMYIGCSATVAVASFVCIEAIGSLSRVFMLSILTSFKIRIFFESLFLKILPPTIISSVTCWQIYPLQSGISWLICVCAITIVINLITVYIIGLTKDERSNLHTILNNIFAKKRCKK